jgi:hypothetical protein
MPRISASDFAVFLFAVSIVVTFFLVARHYIQEASREDRRDDSH